MKIVCMLALAAALGAAPPPRFRGHTVTDKLAFGYQLAAVDVDGDGKIDLIAVDERGTELAWYENPGWQRHVIATGVPRTINIDCADIDGDGVPEIAQLFRFETKPDTSVGIVQLLHHDGDVRGPWKAREIDRVPTAHRVRWIDPAGSGKPVMVLAPMIGSTATPPVYDAAVPIYMYRPGEWKRETISEELRGVLHSLYPVDWNGDGRQELLTASFLGLRLLEPAAGGRWRSREIAKGETGPCPRCGSSEVARGWLGKRRFLAAIEPWHGTEIVIYTERDGRWERSVIDDSFLNGHALAVGDLDGDGRDEVVAGYRGREYRLYIYRAEDAEGRHWRRELLDDGVAAADCKIRDLNGDGRPDIACIGASTANIRWYENLGGGGGPSPR